MQLPILPTNLSGLARHSPQPTTWPRRIPMEDASRPKPWRRQVLLEDATWLMTTMYPMTTAPPTVMGSFLAAIADLPDLEKPVNSYIWRETFMQHARRADAALADFHRELDDCVRPVDTVCESCTDLKDSCANLHTTVTATSSTLPLLVALMGNTHERVLTLEAATAKNEADVATTMHALAATTAAHASTVTAVAGSAPL